MRTIRHALLVGVVVVARARAADNPANKSDLAQLQGTWLMVSGTADGQASRT